MTGKIKKLTAYTGSILIYMKKTRTLTGDNAIAARPTLKKDYPEVEEMVRFASRERTLFKSGTIIFMKRRFIMLTVPYLNIYSQFCGRQCCHCIE